MELRQLKYFLKAKELLNFTEAAEQLNISQSTLSQQIKQLEDELDIPLFNRIGKRVTLTEAGALFADFAFQSINKAQDGLLMLRDLHNFQTGKITIGVTYGLRYVLTPALIRFATQYPQIKIKVVFGTSEELIDKLNHLELDFALSFFGDIAVENHFDYQNLFCSPMTVVTAPDSALAQKEMITLEQITQYPLVLPAKGYMTSKFVHDLFEHHGLSPNIVIEINDIPTLLELVKTGNWHTILAKTSVSQKDGLATIPLLGENMDRTAMIISMKEVYQKKAVKEFYRILHEEINL
ncbi:LysR family transcriptional regulator [Flectobacillus roseus]|uniref:LysR family transcriptional regulator n=1 Tax=Flectobacillus roseus TaxID=502259 RepID=A0ABT6Y259_9BACT|nr:LysR family transcriptional regulator [Flectobacillus roseus]MDI9857596.1 LysR family transcriptional regulator [Flectobacillus roseus]